jgi:cytochrome c553
MIKGTTKRALGMAFVVLALGCGGRAEIQVSTGVGGSEAASGSPGIAVAGSSAGGARGIEISGVAGSSTGATGIAGAGIAGAPALVGDAARGKIAYNAPIAGSPASAPGGACYTCHGVAGEGMYGPNITFATGTTLGSGIGGWTEQQFHDAVRNAVYKDGTPLCVLMVKVPATGAGSASDQDIADIYAYLMSVPPFTPQQGDYCPTGSATGK